MRLLGELGAISTNLLPLISRAPTRLDNTRSVIVRANPGLTVIGSAESLDKHINANLSSGRGCNVSWY